jgi:malate/lactate dehydrogenase
LRISTPNSQVVFTTDPTIAFKDADFAILLGAFPRKQGMERKDLMEKNIAIFKAMGESEERFDGEENGELQGYGRE